MLKIIICIKAAEMSRAAFHIKQLVAWFAAGVSTRVSMLTQHEVRRRRVTTPTIRKSAALKYRPP